VSLYPTRTTGPVAPDNSAGIKQVTAVRVGVDAAHRDALDKLMAPREGKDSFTFSEGPPLLVSSASQLEVQGISVKVADLAKATEALTSAGMTKVDDHTVRVGSLSIELSS